MGEMVERVAAYLWESGAGYRPRSWALLHPDRQEGYRAQARRVINLMREPNATMFDAALERTRDNPSDVWRTMIDAALRA
jgi:hypothetical protein